MSSSSGQGGGGGGGGSGNAGGGDAHPVRLLTIARSTLNPDGTEILIQSSSAHSGSSSGEKGSFCRALN